MNFNSTIKNKKKTKIDFPVQSEGKKNMWKVIGGRSKWNKKERGCSSVSIGFQLSPEVTFSLSFLYDELSVKLNESHRPTC